MIVETVADSNVEHVEWVDVLKGLGILMFGKVNLQGSFIVTIG